MRNKYMRKTHINGLIKLPGWSASVMYLHTQQLTDFSLSVIIFLFLVYYHFYPLAQSYRLKN